jgi:hypothetical protein
MPSRVGAPAARSLNPAARPGDRPALIEIAPGAAPPRSKVANTAQYWANYYRKHDESPQDLREKVSLLNVNKKFADVQAILVAYLTYRSKNAEPWMYGALGLAIEENKGKPDEIRLMFKYAADAARATQNPNHLIGVADVLFLQKQFDLIGPLIDQAMDKVPHRNEPIRMSMNLAEATKDPKRMADAVERLLALGWPGYDDTFRDDARRRVERLAKSLREDGRGAEADAMLAKLPASEARDLYLRLSWTGDADLDLYVSEPLGATASYQSPRTVFGGSIVKNGYGKHPEEVYVCPRGFDGDYSVKVEPIYNNPEKPATQATLEIITHEGTPQESKRVRTIALTPGGKAPEPVVVKLEGGQRKVVLPLMLPPADEKPAAAARAQRKTAVRPGQAPRDAAPNPGTEKR